MTDIITPMLGVAILYSVQKRLLDLCVRTMEYVFSCVNPAGYLRAYIAPTMGENEARLYFGTVNITFAAMAIYFVQKRLLDLGPRKIGPSYGEVYMYKFLLLLFLGCCSDFSLLFWPLREHVEIVRRFQLHTQFEEWVALLLFVVYELHVVCMLSWMGLWVSHHFRLLNHWPPAYGDPNKRPRGILRTGYELWWDWQCRMVQRSNFCDTPFAQFVLEKLPWVCLTWSPREAGIRFSTLYMSAFFRVLFGLTTLTVFSTSCLYIIHVYLGPNYPQYNNGTMST